MINMSISHSLVKSYVITIAGQIYVLIEINYIWFDYLNNKSTFFHLIIINMPRYIDLNCLMKFQQKKKQTNKYCDEQFTSSYNFVIKFYFSYFFKIRRKLEVLIIDSLRRYVC